MSDDDQDDTLRHQFQKLQDQQQRKLQILQKRREEKMQSTANRISREESANSYGVADDLNLKTSEPADIQGFDQPPHRGLDRQNEEIREMKDELGRLRKLVSERDFELHKARRKLDDSQAVQAAGVTGDGAAATKIVELSKKVRELTAELEVERTRSKQLTRKCLEAEKMVNQLSAAGGDVSRGVDALGESQSETQEDARVLQDKVKQAELKVTEYRNQVQTLKAELKVCNRVLAQEVGEGVSVQSLISGSTGWRGRAQQISNLQKKVSDLKKQLDQDKTLNSSSGLLDADSDGMLTQRTGVRLAEEKQKETLKQIELKKRETQEKFAADMKLLEQENESLKQKADAAKARITVLTNENKINKQQIQTLVEKGSHDDELIEALFKQQSQLKQALDESNKKMRDRTNEVQQSKVELNIKHQQDHNIVEQLKSIILEKESRIRTLERENRELQADINIERRRHEISDNDDRDSPPVRDQTRDQMRSPADDLRPEIAARIISEVLSPTPGQRPHDTSRRPYSKTDIDRELARTSNSYLPYLLSSRNHDDKLQEISTLYQALSVDRDRLAELVKVLEKRIQEATHKVAESLTELQTQRRRNALLEKQVGKARVETSSADKKTKVKSNPAQLIVKAGNLEELETKLEIQRDENEALKAALQRTLKAKEEDLKMYMDTIEETKSVFLRGIQQIRTNPSQA